MAEIRKHKPAAGGAIAQALEAALGAAARPTTPGAPPEPRRPASSVTRPTTASATGLPMASIPGGGWTTIDPTSAPVVPKPGHPTEDESDGFEDDQA